MELSDKVRVRREELGLTQEELAMRMGSKSRVSINKIENGRPVSAQIIARLADALGVSIPYLMGFDEKPPAELQDMGALAAQVVMDLDAMGMMRDYMRLGESDRHTVRVLVETLAAKTKKD